MGEGRQESSAELPPIQMAVLKKHKLRTERSSGGGAMKKAISFLLFCLYVFSSCLLCNSPAHGDVILITPDWARTPAPGHIISGDPALVYNAYSDQLLLRQWNPAAGLVNETAGKYQWVGSYNLATSGYYPSAPAGRYFVQGNGQQYSQPFGFDSDSRLWVSFNNPTNYASIGIWKPSGLTYPEDNINIDAYNSSGVLIGRVPWNAATGNKQISIAGSDIKYLTAYSVGTVSGEVGAGFFTNLSFSNYADTNITLLGALDVAGTPGQLNTLNLNTAGARLSGNGTVNGNVSNTAGTVTPGSSAGRINIDGSYSQGLTGKLKMELGGSGSLDYLDVRDLASLNGILEIAFLAGFTPTDGQRFDIMEWGSYDGSRFANIIEPDGWDFDLEYNTTNKHLYLIAHKESIEPPVTTPEPATMLLLGLGIFSLAGVRRFRK
jgi:hypothetical protein